MRKPRVTILILTKESIRKIRVEQESEIQDKRKHKMFALQLPLISSNRSSFKLVLLLI